MTHKVLGVGLMAGLGLLSGCGNVVSQAGSDPTDPFGDSPNGTPGDPGSPDFGCGCGVGNPVVKDAALAQSRDDGSIEVSLTSYPSSCVTYGATAPCGPDATWKVTFVIPPNATNGAVVSLDQNGFFTETDGVDESNSCGGGGGTLWNGQVEILSRDDFGLGLRVSGADGFFLSGDSANGDYYATYCGDAPPTPELLTSAVATPSADGALDLAISSLPNSCSAPSPGGDCAVQVENVFIHLPAAMLTPGVYPLDGLATFSASQPGDAGECAGGGGSYWGGTIEVIGVDASAVSFSLTNTDDFGFPTGNADGSYVAPVCGGPLE